MRDTAGRAASDEHELQIGFASTSTTKAEKQRGAAAAVGLGKAVRASNKRQIWGITTEVN